MNIYEHYLSYLILKLNTEKYRNIYINLMRVCVCVCV